MCYFYFDVINNELFLNLFNYIPCLLRNVSILIFYEKYIYINKSFYNKKEVMDDSQHTPKNLTPNSNHEFVVHIKITKSN